jgi:tetratricopeptide (TPR) repeat protein
MSNSKEIFRLRKEGQLLEALALAKSEYSKYPDDVWVKRAYGWVICDRCKELIREQSVSEAATLLSLLDGIEFPDAEEALLSSIRQLRRKFQAGDEVYARARALHKAGDYLEAIRAFQSVEQAFGSDLYFQEAYGWAVAQYLKQRSTSVVHLPESLRLVSKYLSLNNQTPSLLHSQILRWVMKIADENEMFPFLALFHQWLQKGGFADADYQVQMVEGKSYPSLAERAFMMLGRQLMAHPGDDRLAVLMPVLDEAIGRFPANIWLPYYKANVLIHLKRYTEALDFVVAVVRVKSNDYWTWALLAETLKHTDQHKAISCYCKALLCKTDEKYLPKVHAHFGDLLQQAGLLGEAKTEYLKSISIRKELGYKIPQQLTHVTEQAWFRQTAPYADMRSFYLQNVALAESTLFDDLPWTDANVGEHFERPEEPGVVRVKIYFMSQKGLEQLAVKDRRFGITRRFSMGQPIKVKLGQQGGRRTLYLLEPRLAGRPWDMFPHGVGVVTHVNAVKQLGYFVVSKSVSGTIKIPAETELRVGDFLSLIYRIRKKDDRQYYEVIDWQRTENIPGKDVFQRKSAVFKLHDAGTFGFVGDVYIPAEVIQKYHMQPMNGQLVMVDAVISFNTQKKTWSWRALKVTPVDAVAASEVHTI